MKALLGPLAFSFLILLAPTPALAQENPIKLELLSLSFNGTVKGLYYRNGKDVVEMLASQQGIGAPFLYKGPRVISLYDDPSHLAPRKDDEPAPKPVLQALLPSEKNRALLVFAFSEKNKGVPGVKVYGIDTGDMKNGDYRLFNFSKNSIAGILGGKQKAALKPKQNTLLSSTKWRSDILDLDVQFATPINGKLERVYSSVWGHRPERRMFVFVFDRPDKNRPLDIRMFFDVPAIKSPALTAELKKE